MKRSCKNIFVVCSALMAFLTLSAGERKHASSLLAYSDGTKASVLRIEVGDQAGHDQLETELEAENRKLKQRVHSLRQQNRLLTEVADSYEPFLPLHREREQLRAESEFLEKQNRILAEFCPLLKEAARQEFSGGCEPDIAAAWGVKE